MNPKMTQSERHRLLLEALLEEPAHRELYQTSAWFKTSIDDHVRETLPTLVAGLAARAEQEEARYRAMLASIRMPGRTARRPMFSLLLEAVPVKEEK